jgi:hypothetical protein
MRYQIHRLQQQALVDLDLNTEEALLLDWLLNWKDGGNMERIVVGDDLAYWVNYSKVVEELPILFGKPKSNSEEDIEKAKKSNTTKVARMLKGNLSKVLTRHEKKVQGRTKIYVSFNREILDILLNNKKASSTAIDEASNNIKSSTSINNSYNKSIPQKDKKDTKKNKTLKNKFNDGTNNHFENYEPKELENLLNESQKGKFKELEETAVKFKANYMDTMNKS